MSRLFSRLILAFLVVAVFVGITGVAQTTYAGSPPRKPCIPRPVTSEMVVPAVPVPCGPNDDESSPACRAEMRQTVKPLAWPATALEALPLAEDEARKWRQDAFLLEVEAVLLASEWEQIGLDGRANRWYFIFGDKGVFGGVSEGVSQGYEVARTQQDTTGKTIILRTSHQQVLQRGGIYPVTDSSSFLSLAVSQYGLADWLKAKPGRTIYRLHYWDSGYQPGWQVQGMESDETVGYNLIFHGQEAWIWQMDGVARIDKTPPPPSAFQTTGIYYAGSDHGQYTFTRSWRQSNGLGQTIWSQELANLALELLKQAVASGQPPTVPSGISGIEGAVHGGGQNSPTAGYDGLIGGAGDITMGIATYQRPGGIMTVEIVSR
jgi:hypothetical protein